MLEGARFHKNVEEVLLFKNLAECRRADTLLPIQCVCPSKEDEDTHKESQ